MKKSDESEAPKTPIAKVEPVDTVPEEKTKSARGLYFQQRSNADTYSQIFPPYTGNLWAIESKQDNVYNPLLTDNNAAVAEKPSYFPYEYDNYYGQDENQEKTLTGLGDAFGGGSGTGDGPPGDDVMLARAALPVAVAGFLALTLSSLFSGTLAVNTTSKEAVPTLWQIPIDYTPPERRRREADYENEVETDSPFGLGSGVMEKVGAVTERIQDGLILFAMAEADRECARKIACIFGAETRKSGHKTLIMTAVERFMPDVMGDFKTEFSAAARARSFDRQDCQMYTCSKCFSV